MPKESDARQEIEPAGKQSFGCHPGLKSTYIHKSSSDWCAESQKQYWQVKSKYRDTIIFFKVGKFYELYEVSLQSVCRLVQNLICARASCHCCTI